MKILVLHSELGVLRGGGENFTRNLFTAFAERGHQVAAAFVSHWMRGYPIPLPVGIEPIPVRGWWSRKLGQATLSFINGLLPTGSRMKTEWDRVQDALCCRTIRWHGRRFQKRIERTLRRRWDNFDVVYVHGNIPLASYVARSRPTVLRLPGPVAAEAARELRTVQAVCANGDALVRLRTFLGEHVIELPVGVNEKLFTAGPTAIRAALGWTAQDIVIGYVGRLAYVKGIDLLATAFHTVSSFLPQVRLLIIGSGEEEKKIRLILAKELARGIVHIEPDVAHEQLPPWYRAMNLLVMPSRYENFSNAVLEAMSCGLPVLASNVGGNTKIEEVGNGWLFQPGSLPSLTERLGSVIENPEAMCARGAAGSQYVRERYSWAASAACLEGIVGQRLGIRI